MRLRQLGRHALIERAATGSEQEERPRQVGDGLDTTEDRVGGQHHAGPPAERAVVHRAPGVVRTVPQVVHAHVERAGLGARPRMDVPQ